MTPERDAFGNEIGGSAPTPGPAPVPTRMPASPSGLPAAPAPAPAPRAPSPTPLAGPPQPSGPMTRSGMAPALPIASRATNALVLGIFAVFFWPVAPFAWRQGSRAIAEIDASRGMLGGRGTATVGRVLGIVFTILLALSVFFLGLGAILSATKHH